MFPQLRGVVTVLTESALLVPLPLLWLLGCICTCGLGAVRRVQASPSLVSRLGPHSPSLSRLNGLLTPLETLAKPPIEDSTSASFHSRVVRHVTGSTYEQWEVPTMGRATVIEPRSRVLLLFGRYSAEMCSKDQPGEQTGALTPSHPFTYSQASPVLLSFFFLLGPLAQVARPSCSTNFLAPSLFTLPQSCP